MTDKPTGGCSCGAVRYRLESTPMYVHCCHCTFCQTETGSAFAINLLIESDRVTLLSGAPRSVMIPSESGKGQLISRCPECAIAVWSNYDGAGDRIRFVRGGTLDDPKAVGPDIHIYTRSKLPWVRLPEDAQAVEAYYSPAEIWPEESFARRKALFG